MLCNYVTEQYKVITFHITLLERITLKHKNNEITIVVLLSSWIVDLDNP